MKELQNVLKIVSDGLKTIAKGVEAIAEKVDEVAESQSSVKPRRKRPPTAAKKTKVVKKPARKVAKKKEVKAMTAAETVYRVISRSKKGITTATIMEKTGYNQKKVANFIYRLKKQGKIKSVQRGVYIKS